MSYDLDLIEPNAATENADQSRIQGEAIWNVPINPAREAVKRRVANALIAKNPQLGIFKFDYDRIASIQKLTTEEAKLKYRHFELNATSSHDNGIQIRLYDDAAFVTVPYWHSGEKAREVFKEIWSYLEIITKEAGYVVFNPQRGTIVELSKDFERIVSDYTGNAGYVLKEVARVKACAIKPWWRFWM